MGSFSLPLPPPLMLGTPSRSGSSDGRSLDDGTGSVSNGTDEASERTIIVYEEEEEEEEGSLKIAALDESGNAKRSNGSFCSSSSSSDSGKSSREELPSSDHQRPSRIGTKPDYYYCDVKTCRSTTCLACCRGRRSANGELSTALKGGQHGGGSGKSNATASVLSDSPTTPAGPQWISTANYVKPDQIRCMPDRWWENDNQYDTDSLFDLLSYVFGGFDLDTSIFSAPTIGAPQENGKADSSVQDADDETAATMMSATSYGETMASF